MFDPVGICKILNEERVDYVVIGGFAAVAHGSSLPTRDIDILPSAMSAMSAASSNGTSTRSSSRSLKGCRFTSLHLTTSSSRSEQQTV